MGQMKKALITGPFGQDGSYLCELLSGYGYEVHGIARKSLSENSERIKSFLTAKIAEPIIHYCDLNEFKDVKKTLEQVKPDEIYHLAARNFSSELSTEENDRALYKNNVSATFNILTAANQITSDAKIVLAGSCLMFDDNDSYPQDISTPFQSRSFYGLAKICEHQIAKFFRNMGMHISVAILYNHESPRRAPNFVTRKIIKNLVELKNNQRKSFQLGSLDTKKDWGYAKDYVKAMWLMTQRDIPNDYVIATGKTKTIKDFVEAAAFELGIKNCMQYININPSLIKRSVDNILVGDPSIAKNQLGWEHSLSFNHLVGLMVKNEIAGSLD